MNILIRYLRYLFVLYANERYTKLYSNKLKCINFTKDKTKDKSLSFVNYLKRVVSVKGDLRA